MNKARLYFKLRNIWHRPSTWQMMAKPHSPFSMLRLAVVDRRVPPMFKVTWAERWSAVKESMRRKELLNRHLWRIFITDYLFFHVVKRFLWIQPFHCQGDHQCFMGDMRRTDLCDWLEHKARWHADNRIVHNMDELADEVGVDKPDQIAKALYKNTDCGVSFLPSSGGVTIWGFAEGYDADLPPHHMAYPFKAVDFWNEVDDADAEGCDAWEHAHREEA